MPETNLLSLRSDLILSLDKFEATIKKAEKRFAELDEQAYANFKIGTAKAKATFEKIEKRLEGVQKLADFSLNIKIGDTTKALQKTENTLERLAKKAGFEFKANDTQLVKKAEDAKALLADLKAASKITAKFDASSFNSDIKQASRLITSLSEEATTKVKVDTSELDDAQAKQSTFQKKADMLSFEKAETAISNIQKKFIALDKEAYVNFKVGTTKAKEAFDKIESRLKAIHAKGDVKLTATDSTLNTKLDAAKEKIKDLKAMSTVSVTLGATSFNAEVAKASRLITALKLKADKDIKLDASGLDAVSAQVERLIDLLGDEKKVTIGTQGLAASVETAVGILGKLQKTVDLIPKVKSFVQLRADAVAGNKIVKEMVDGVKLKPSLDLKTFKTKIRTAARIFSKLDDQAVISLTLSIKGIQKDVAKAQKALGEVSAIGTTKLKLDPETFYKNLKLAKDALFKLSEKARITLHLIIRGFRTTVTEAADLLKPLNAAVKLRPSIITADLKEDAIRAGKVLTEMAKKGRVVPRLHLQKFKQDAAEAKQLVTDIKKDSRFDADMSLTKLRDKTVKAKALLEGVAVKGVFKPKIDDKDFTVSAGKLSGMFDKVGKDAGSGFAANLKAGILSDVVTGAIQRLGDLFREVFRGVAATISDTLEEGANFESQFASVRTLAAAAGESAEDIDALRESAIAVAAVLPLDTTDLGSMAETLTRAGKSAEDQANGLLDVTAKLQVGTQTVAEAAAGAVAAGSNLLDTGGDFSKLGDIIAFSANNANQTVADLKGTLTGLKGIRLDAEDFALFSTVLAEGGITGSSQGTHIRNTLNFLQKQSEWFESIGFKIFDANGNMRNQAELVVELAQEYKLLNDEQRTQINKKLGERGAPLIKMMSELTSAEIQSIQEQAAAANGTLDQMAENMMQGTSQAGQQLGATVQAIQTQIGTGLATITGSISRMLSEGLKQLDTTALLDNVRGAAEGLMSNFGSFSVNADTGAQTFTPNEEVQAFLAGAAQRLEAWFASLPEKVEGFKAAIANIFERIRQVREVVSPIISSIVNGAQAAFEVIRSLLTPIVTAIRDKIVEVYNSFKASKGEVDGTVSKLAEWKDVAANVGQIIASIGKTLFDISAEIVKAILKAGKWVIESKALRKTFEVISGLTAKVFKFLEKWGKPIGKTLVFVGKIAAIFAAISAASAAWSAIMAAAPIAAVVASAAALAFAIKKAFDATVFLVKKFAEGLGKLKESITASDQWKAAIERLKGIVEGVKKLFGDVLQRHKDSAKAIGGWITQFEGVQRVMDAISPKFDGLRNMIQGITDNIASWIPNLKEFFAQANRGQGQGGGSGGFSSPIAGQSLSDVVAYQQSSGQDFDAYRQGRNRVAHGGIDFDGRIGAGEGGVVQSVTEGVVKSIFTIGDSAEGVGASMGVIVESLDSLGNVIQQRYNHLSRASLGNLAVGDQLSSGQRIGTVGPDDTASDGAHLDYKVLVNNQFVNPDEFLALAGAAGQLSTINISNGQTGTTSIGAIAGSSGGGVTLSQSTINDLGDFADLFSGGSNSIAARVIGVSEGNRTTSGGFNSSFDGHTDMGNGAFNQGSFSAQQGFRDGAAADEYWNQKLRDEYLPQFLKAASKVNLDGNMEVLMNFLDLAIQSPLAATAEGGFLDQLPAIAAAGATPNAIRDARVQSYYNPDTGQLQAGGFGNDLSRLTADQNRRMSALTSAMNSLSIDGAATSLPDTRTSAPATSTSSTSTSTANGLDIETEIEGVSSLTLPDATIDGGFLSEEAKTAFDEWKREIELTREGADRTRSLERESAAENRSSAILDARDNDNEALASVLEQQQQLVELQNEFYDKKLEADRQLEELYQLRDAGSTDPLLTQDIAQTEQFRRDLVARETEAFENLRSQVSPVFRELSEQTEQLTEKTTELGRSFGLAEDIESKHLQALEAINQAHDEQSKRIQEVIRSYATLLESQLGTDQQNAEALANIEDLVAQQTELNDQRDRSIALAQQEFQAQREAQILAAEAVANRLQDQAVSAEQELLQAQIRSAELDGRTRVAEMLRRESEELKIQEQYRRRMLEIANEERSLIEAANEASPTGEASNEELIEIEQAAQASRDAADASRAISLAEVNQQASELADKLNNDVRSGLTNILTALTDGTKSIGDALKNMVKNIANTFIQSGIKKLVDNMMTGNGTGGGIGGFLGGLFGGSSGKPAIGGSFADGGEIPYVGGNPNADSTPIMAMPGEYMLSRKMVAGLGGLKSVARLAKMAEKHKAPQYLAKGGPVDRSSLIPQVSTNVERTTQRQNFTFTSEVIGEHEMVSMSQVNDAMNKMGVQMRTETNAKIERSERQNARRLATSRSYRNGIGI